MSSAKISDSEKNLITALSMVSSHGTSLVTYLVPHGHKL